jgi:hypothetical protein
MDLVQDKRPRHSDNLLVGSFLASIIINVLLVVLLGNSHLFDTPQAPKMVTIKTIRPPLLVKKPPHPPKPPPPPPQKPVVVKTPVIHPPVPQPVAHVTYVPHVMTVQSTAPSNVAVQETPQVAPVPQPTAPTTNSTSVAPPAPPAPAPPSAPGPPAPAEAPPGPPAPPAPPAPEHVAIPDRAEPECLTPWPTDISSEVSYDPNSLLATTVTLSFTVGVDGSVKNIAFDQRTGNDDLDALLTKIVQDSKWKPAVQDGTPRATHFSHVFQLQ